MNFNVETVTLNLTSFQHAHNKLVNYSGNDVTLNLTSFQHAHNELFPGDEAIAVLVLSSEEVCDSVFLRVNPVHIPLSPEVKVEILKALQLYRGKNITWLQLRNITVNRSGMKEGKKEMFYLTTHSTHFILRLYDVRHMVKNHSDRERGNLLLPHRLLLSINSKGSFICTIPQTG